MTPEEIALIQESFARVYRVKGPLAACFYEHLFRLAPEARGLFPDDMTAQRERMVDTLAAIVRNLHQLDQVTQDVEALARSHVGYGARPEHFGPVGIALVHALKTHHPGGLSEETCNAWVEAYALLSHLMIEEMDALRA